MKKTQVQNAKGRTLARAKSAGVERRGIAPHRRPCERNIVQLVDALHSRRAMFGRLCRQRFARF